MLLALTATLFLRLYKSYSEDSSGAYQKKTGARATLSTCNEGVTRHTNKYMEQAELKVQPCHGIVFEPEVSRETKVKEEQ